MKILFKLSIIIITLSIFMFSIVCHITTSANIKILKNQAEEKLQTLVVDTLDKIDRLLSERISDIEVFATDSIISSKNSTPHQITKRLFQFRNIYKRYTSLTFYNLQKTVIADTSGLGIGTKITNFEYWDNVFQNNISTAKTITISKTLKIPVIFFAALVKDNNKPIGILISKVPIYRIYEILNSINSALHVWEDLPGEVYLVDKNGLLLYSNVNHKGILKDNLSGWEEFKMAASGKKTGKVKIYDSNGEEKIGVFGCEQGYLDFKGNNWTLIIRVPTKVIFAPINALQKQKMFAMVLMVFLIIIFTMFLSYRLSKPIDILMRATKDFGKGKLDAKVDIKSNDEIGQLGAAFNQMVDDLKKNTISIENLNKEIIERKKIEKQLEGKTRELQKSKENLANLATHDALTEIPNRLYLNQNISQIVSNAKRHNRKMALFVIDIDDFKLINDNFGHDVGDKVLKAMTSIIVKNVRKEDVLARIGGDEFVLLLTEIKNYADATTIANKILKLLRVVLNIDSNNINLAVSIGVTLYPLLANNINKLFKQADIALYKAKNSGKNRVELYCDKN